MSRGARLLQRVAAESMARTGQKPIEAIELTRETAQRLEGQSPEGIAERLGAAGFVTWLLEHESEGHRFDTWQRVYDFAVRDPEYVFEGGHGWSKIVERAQ